MTTTHPLARCLALLLALALTLPGLAQDGGPQDADPEAIYGRAVDATTRISEDRVERIGDGCEAALDRMDALVEDGRPGMAIRVGVKSAKRVARVAIGGVARIVHICRTSGRALERLDAEGLAAALADHCDVQEDAIRAANGDCRSAIRAAIRQILDDRDGGDDTAE